ILAAGGHYDATLNVQLPDGIQGNFYILVFTDSNLIGPPDTPGVDFEGYPSDLVMARVHEFQGEGNNITSAALPVLLRLPAALQVPSVLAQGPDPSQPGHVFTGQNYTVTYTVTNAGAGDTPDRQSEWDDQVYLSRDPILDSADTYLTTIHHTGGLTAGA